MSAAMDRDELPLLVADVGGTKIEFGRLSRDGRRLGDVRTLATGEYETIEAAVEAYLEAGTLPRPEAIALAIAGPITGDTVALTNGHWHFSIAASRVRLGVAQLAVLNDFTALALGLPAIRSADRIQLGGGEPEPDAPIGLIGPGTGLGVSGLVRVGHSWQALAGEGGHVTLAPEDEQEDEVLRILRRRFGHVSAERVLSGPGISNLFMALSELAGAPAVEASPEAITEAALAGGATLAGATLSMFCSFLGSAAGNLALTLGARGGVYIGGGISRRFPHLLQSSRLRERFEAKGRMRPYLEPIPLWLNNAPHTALYGAAAALLAQAASRS